jgi:hypothetical protein
MSDTCMDRERQRGVPEKEEGRRGRGWATNINHSAIIETHN